MSTLISILGIVVLLGIAFLLSNNHKAINFRTVLGALAIQIGIGALILYVPVGRDALLWLSEGISKVIAYGNEGISFLFGGLVSDKMFEVFGGGGFVFALRVLPIIVFFSALISVLYYIGIMQWIIKIIGGGLQKLLGTSKAESMSAAANIFVGQTEAPLIVKPYISKMTESELFAIMWWFSLNCRFGYGWLCGYGRTITLLNRSFVYGSTSGIIICKNPLSTN